LCRAAKKTRKKKGKGKNFKKKPGPLVCQAEKGEIKLYSVDAAHFVMEPYLGFLWCFARCSPPSAHGRKRYNVLGALDLKG
jgi:hypothetical protein